MKKYVAGLFIGMAALAIMACSDESLLGNAVQTTIDCSGCSAAGDICHIKTQEAYFCDGTCNTCNGTSGPCSGTALGTCRAAIAGQFDCVAN